MTQPPQFPGQPQPGQPQQPGQPGPVYAAPPAKPKKPLLKKWWVWVLIVLGLLVVWSAVNGSGSKSAEPAAGETRAPGATAPAAGAPAASSPPAPATSAVKPKEKLTLDDGWAIDKSNQFAVYVNGYVSNNTDKAITNYVQITFDALDAKGANLGTCLANTNTIDANGKWKFKAICTGEAKEIDTVRFKSITGF